MASDDSHSEAILFIDRRNFTKGLLALGLSSTLLTLATVSAADVQHSAGFQQQALTISSGDIVDVAIWYPTTVNPTALTLGPITMQVAANAQPNIGKHPLVVISHGTGGMNLDHHEIAMALAKTGSVVVALTHPKDNYRDRSMVGNIAYFSERPKQVSAVLDSVLKDPRWSTLIDADKIGFVGHSAGGFTGLALLGATPSIATTVKHCATDYESDLWFCQVSGTKERALENAKNAAYLPLIPSTKDTRFKAAVLIAPVGAFTEAKALSSITTPTLVYVAGKDEALVPKFHAAAVALGIPKAERIDIAEGGHFMLVSKLNLPANTSIAINGAEVNADPPGFDRTQAIKVASEFIPKWLLTKMR
jgi:predicted dienelactone hydrolase